MGKVALLEKRDAHLAQTALAAVANRMEQKGEDDTAARLREIVGKMDANEIHIVYQAATA